MNRPLPHPLPRSGPLDAARRLVRALAALVALLALIVAVPLVLLRWGTWPITGLPTWEQVRDLPTTLARDDAILAVVTLALWAAWAGFVLSVVLEAVAQVRGRVSGVRLGPLGSAARYLVSSLVLSIGPLAGPGSALASPASSPPQPVAAAPAPAVAAAPDMADGTFGPPASSLAGDPLAAAAATGAPDPLAPGTVTVGRGDTPWSLAQAHLGDGTRWREVWDVNQGRLQPDGGTWTSPDAPLRPGWVLSLPTEVTVAGGDNLWDLTEARLETAWGREASDAEVVGPWQVMVEANLDRLAPPGDPDLIYPGQVMVGPALSADPLAPPDAGETAGEAPATGEVPDGGAGPSEGGGAPATEQPEAGSPGGSLPGDVGETVPEGTAPVVEVPEGGTPPVVDVPEGTTPPVVDVPEGTTPTTPATTTPSVTAPPDTQSPGTVPDTTASSVTAPASSGSGGAGPVIVGGSVAATAPAEDEDDGPAPTTVGLVGGGVAVAGALVLLDRRRRAQQRHRRRGRVLPFPAPPLRTAEHHLRWGADVDAARLLDVSLRTAAAGSGATGMPPLRWVEASSDGVVLVLAEPSPPAPGFTAVAPDRWVTAAGYDELAHLATRAAPPAPSLVPLGATDDGSELLIELEASGIVAVGADADDALGLLRSFVVAASTAAWSDQPRVVTVGLEPEVGRLPGVTVDGQRR